MTTIKTRLKLTYINSDSTFVSVSHHLVCNETFNTVYVLENNMKLVCSNSSRLHHVPEVTVAMFNVVYL